MQQQARVCEEKSGEAPQRLRAALKGPDITTVLFTFASLRGQSPCCLDKLLHSDLDSEDSHFLGSLTPCSPHCPLFAPHPPPKVCFRGIGIHKPHGFRHRTGKHLALFFLSCMRIPYDGSHSDTHFSPNKSQGQSQLNVADQTSSCCKGVWSIYH